MGKPSRACALLFALLACGKKDEPPPVAKSEEAPRDADAAPPAKAEPPVDPHGGKLDPGHEPERFVRTAEGTVELTIDGTPQPLTHLPFGRNAAVWIPDKQQGRVTIAASEADKGPPSLSLVLQGYKLDELVLPRAFTAEGARNAQGLIRMTWQIDEDTTFRTRDEDTRAGLNRITLDSWKEGTLTGSFEGQVVGGPPGKPATQTKKLTGKFSVKLRLNGVQPDALAPAKSGKRGKPAKPDKGAK